MGILSKRSPTTIKHYNLLGTLGIDAMKALILEILVRSMKNWGSMNGLLSTINKHSQSRDISNLRFVSINLGNLGNAYKALEDYEQAAVYCTEAIEISRKVGIKRSVGIQLGNLGDLFIKLGKWDEAERNLLESIRLCTSLLPLYGGCFLVL